MLTKLAIAVGITSLAMSGFVSSASAHHAFAAEFDSNKPVNFKGKITKMEWVNPHTWIHVGVTNEDGTKEVWMVEGGTPNSLLRRGLKRDTLKIGQEVIVDGYQSKDRSNRANGRDITLPDGQKFFLGSSGTGAPYDAPGKDQRK